MTMGFGGPGAGGNFLEQLLGDLLNLMGGGAGGDRAELARSLAEGVASGGEPEANVDPAARIRLEELMRVAELHVAELTSLPAASAGGVRLAVVTPAQWARRTVDDWRFLLEAMIPPAPAPAEAGSALTVPGDDGAGELMARFMATMGPMMAAMQLGSAVGHLARVTTGQYELPIPRPGGDILVVSANVDAFAAQWGVAVDEVRLWVALREATAHAVLAVPHVAERVRTLLTAVVEGMSGEAAGLMERLQSLDPTDPDALQQMLGDPEALFGAERSPEQERASADLTAVICALVGYVDHVVDRVGTRLLGGRGALAEAWRRRQVARDSSARSAELLFGIDLDPVQTDRGARFVQGVVERAGDDGLAALWRSAATLPTPAEIEAPGLWLERISYEEPPTT